MLEAMPICFSLRGFISEVNVSRRDDARFWSVLDWFLSLLTEVLTLLLTRLASSMHAAIGRAGYRCL